VCISSESATSPATATSTSTRLYRLVRGVMIPLCQRLQQTERTHFTRPSSWW